ncbi:MAG: nickel pincer cofactor biosynthesis protein LarB [Planctomycetota bacterium]
MLAEVQAGRRSLDDAIRALRAPHAAAGHLDFATVDHERALRCGLPEVVFCHGKRPADAAAIAAEIHGRAGRVLLTRADAEHAAAVRERLPQAVHHERARCLTVTPPDQREHGLVAVVCAGTADLPVAEEAAITARFAGSKVATFPDVGVAGLHRLVARLAEIRAANAIVAVAGMEGALPSVLAGLVDRPVIAVPTSIGYGVSFGGLAALLAMMNSCAAGVAVVNIDNGFGAGYLAAQINQRAAPPPPHP